MMSLFLMYMNELLQNEVVPHGGKMRPKIEESISFILDGKKVVKNVMLYRIITYNKIKEMPVTTVQNIIPGLDDSRDAYDEAVLSEERKFDFHGHLKSLKRVEKKATTKIKFSGPGNEKIADIKILENGKEITGTRCYSENECKYYEEFSDGSKGFAEFTEDGKKLLHLVERNGHEQINTLDSNGNVKSMKHKNWLGYDSYDEYIINDSITYKVSQKGDEKKESVRVTEFSSSGEKLREIYYIVD